MRYIGNILPVTRQNQIAGQLPRKAYASLKFNKFAILKLRINEIKQLFKI